MPNRLNCIAFKILGFKFVPLLLATTVQNVQIFAFFPKNNKRFMFVRHSNKNDSYQVFFKKLHIHNRVKLYEFQMIGPNSNGEVKTSCLYKNV